MSEKRSSEAWGGLQFNVSQLLKTPTGTRRDYDIEVDLLPLDGNMVIVAPVRGHVGFLRAGSGILVTGRLETAVELECTRCLSEFRLPVSLEIEEEFRPTVDIATGAVMSHDGDQDVANLIDEHHILDLAEVVRQDVWLGLPTSPVCRPDCQGLCPHCGQNRDQGSCTCETETIDLRWAPLIASVSDRGD
jgi:uncharacterized protein